MTKAKKSDPDAPIEASTEAPILNLTTLNVLTTTIDMLNTTGHRLGLKDELVDLYGAQIMEVEGAGWVVDMQGIETLPADSLETALTNWANAARREIAQASEAPASEPAVAAAEPDAPAAAPDAAAAEPDAPATDPDAAAAEPDAPAVDPDAAA